MARPLTLEICIATLADALAARDGGAGRLELNAALALGGLTPSLGTLIEIKRAVPLPVVAMLRPRPGGFLYGEADLRVMRRDLGLLLEHGADGIAFGVLTEAGEIDVARCRELIREIASAGREVVLHRAFDVTPDPFVALEQLIDLGVTRILTSGQQEGAYQGAPLIADLIRRAAGRIEILPAGGINRFTLADVVARTGCDQVHASLTRSYPDASTAQRPAVRFGSAFRSPEDRFDGTDPSAIADLVQRLRGA